MKVTYKEAFNDPDGYIKLYLSRVFARVDGLFIEKKEIEGIFTNARVDRDTVPEGKYAYDFRHDEYGDIINLEPKVIVNHAGTFLCEEEIIFPDVNDPYIFFDDITNSYSFSFIKEKE